MARLAAPPESSPKTQRRQPSFETAVSLGLIVALGLIVGGWLEYYTDWFPIVAALISAGGIFSWIPFVIQKLPKGRLKWLTNRLSGAAFGSPVVRRVLLAAISLVLIAFNFTGTIQVETPPDSIEKILRIGFVGATTPGAGLPLRPGEQVRAVRFTSWFSNRQFRVKVSGYPDQIVTLHPWQRTRLTVPGSFLRPVVLLRPDPELHEELANFPLTLVVTAGGVSREIQEYRGETVWVGCERDVDIPPSLQEEWRTELAAKGRPLFLRNWMRPLDLSPGLEVKAGDEIEVEIRVPQRADAAYPKTRFRVSQLYRPQDFPQVEDLHATHN